MKTLESCWVLMCCLFVLASATELYLDHEAYRAIVLITLGGKNAGVFYLTKIDDKSAALQLETALAHDSTYDEFLDLLRQNEEKSQPRYGLVQMKNERGERRLVFITFIPKSASEESAKDYEELKVQALRFTPASFKIDANSTEEISQDVVKKVINGPVSTLCMNRKIVSKPLMYQV